MKIGWVEISKKRYGGSIYDELSRKVLSRNFDLELISVDAHYLKKIRYLRIPEALIYLCNLKGGKDLWIRNFFSTITFPIDKTNGKNLAIVYHIDFSTLPLVSQPVFFLFEKIFYQNLKKVNAILTISEYWRKHFLDKGYKNVYKIYNGFDLSLFNITEQEVTGFKKKFNLLGKPIVYLGNCQKGKGVVDAYQSLKNLDVFLVTSGRPQVNIPAINLDLNYRDYLCLLKSSSVVITMSQFKEGWCRTAHESMLLKTPVIGSGLGGMKELLDGGGQIVCHDFRELKDKVNFVLQNPEIGKTGYDFAKKFTMDKFEKEWINLINKIL